MVNPRKLSDVWATVVRKLAGDEVGVSFQPEMQKGLDATASAVVRDIKANREGPDGSVVRRPINRADEGVKDATHGCKGPRSPEETFRDWRKRQDETG
jgi:hypothetical protein